MATLLELNTIEINSTADPATATGDVLLAVQLRKKVRTAVIKRSNVILGTALPTDATRGDALELLAWAQRAVNNPDSAAGTVLRLTLASVATATVAGILAATDQAIEDSIGPVLPLLAKGMHTG